VIGDLLADPSLSIEAEPDAGWVAGSGDLATTAATVKVTQADGEEAGPVSTPLSHQTVWQPADGGLWQIRSHVLVRCQRNWDLTIRDLAAA